MYKNQIIVCIINMMVTLTQAEFKKKYGLSREVINFYIKIKQLYRYKKDGRIYYNVADNFDNLILEKGTVYKYCFTDSWKDDLKQYVDFIKYTSKVRYLTKDEIEEYEKELKRRDKK